MRQDVTRDEQEVVSALRQALAEQIGSDRYALWFGTGVRWERDGQTLLIAVGDEFLADQLRRQFRRDLQLLWTQHAGPEAAVRFSVDPALKACRSKRDRGAVSDGNGRDAHLDRATGAATAKPETPKPGLPRRADLHSLIVGDSNRLAHTAALGILKRPGITSPLVLHGPTGCGKTLLLEGLWSAFSHRCRPGRAVMLSAEQFTSHFLAALRGGGLPSFRRKVRDVDFLAIDDVQFFVGKRATLVELQHTMDSLLRRNAQIVLTIDRPPATLSGLGPELVGRFTGGLVCAVEPPDEEMRYRILQQVARRVDLRLPSTVARWLADQLPGDARRLAGAVHRLEIVHATTASEITLESARSALSDFIQVAQPAVELRDIEQAVCDVFGLDRRTLRNGCKSKSVSHPRMLAMWLARKYTRAAFAEISHHFGRRSHSTVIAATKKVDRWVADQATLQLGQAACSVDEAIRRVEHRLRTG